MLFNHHVLISIPSPEQTGSYDLHLALSPSLVHSYAGQVHGANEVSGRSDWVVVSVD